MSDDILLQRTRTQKRRLDQLASADRSGIRMPYAQRALNPFPFASSGNAFCDINRARDWTILAFLCGAYVATTNNGTNYWTIDLISLAGTVYATVNTSAGAANTGLRLAAGSVTQPATGISWLVVRATATGTPGAIYILPELIVF